MLVANLKDIWGLVGSLVQLNWTGVSIRSAARLVFESPRRDALELDDT